MSKTVGDFLVERLLEWNITRIFGYPGDGIDGIMCALNRAGDKKFSQQVHWAYGTSWGVTRGLLSLFGLKSLPATFLHFAAIYSTASITPSSLKVAPRFKKNRQAKNLLLMHCICCVCYCCGFRF